MAEKSLNKFTIATATDIALGETIANFEKRCRVRSKPFKKPLSEPKTLKIWHIQSYKSNPHVRKSLEDKLDYIIERNSPNTQERIRLHRELLKCINKEKHRRRAQGIVSWNHCLGQMTKVWPSKGMTVNEIALEMQVKTPTKNVFDMTFLNESLEIKSDASDIKKKAEELAKEYLSFVEEKKEYFRKSETIRKLASKVSKKDNKDSFSSSKHQKYSSLTRLVKKVYGDAKNVHIFSFRPLIKVKAKSSQTVSSFELQESHGGGKGNEEMLGMVGGNRLQSGPSPCEGVSNKFGQEIIIIMKSPCADTGGKKSVKKKGDLKATNKPVQILKPARLPFNTDLLVDKHQKSESLWKQQLRCTISHDRQLSRLKNTNSNRGDFLEKINIQETSTAQNIDEQGMVELANRRRELVEKLREQIETFRQNITEALEN